MPSALAYSVVTGAPPPALMPQVATLLDEAPFPLFVTGVVDIAARLA